ncbi:MAG TPA: SCO family protein [Polyangiaceae bacterium]|nr:SCO family protein [Polyangiaceae bacterium]
MTRTWAVILAGLLALDAASVQAPSSCSVSPPPAVADARPSIYPLSVRLRDQDGSAAGLDVFRGHPVVVSMFYGSCPAACPLIISRIRDVEAALPAEARAELRVLLVSFDPEHDTPAALRALADRRQLDLGRWKLVAGADDEVRPLAAALGITYHQLPEGGFSHSSVLTVLDRDGRPVARSDDLGADVGPLVRAVKEASR